MKKISVITINYNNCDGLRRTLESVAAQTCKDFEYIVIDGGSTDGSVELIKQYESIITYWVSEPDRGIYHAMNKGVAKATGEYCNFLNSGDKYHDKDVIKNLVSVHADAKIITGKIRYVTYIDNRPQYGRIKTPYPAILTDNLLDGSVLHPSSLIDRQLLIDNPFDESLKIVSDWKFFFEELIIHEVSYQTLDFIVVDFDISGFSFTQGDFVAEERAKVLNSWFPPKLIRDYISKIKGRTPLEQVVYYSNPHGFAIKILTLTANILTKFNKMLRK